MKEAGVSFFYKMMRKKYCPEREKMYRKGNSFNR